MSALETGYIYNLKINIMKQTFLKSWATTLIGIALIGFTGYKVWTDPGMSIESAAGMFVVGLGFIASKDATASHTKP